MSVSCECCEVEVFASGWSLFQRSPTECTLLECDWKSSPCEERTYQTTKEVTMHVLYN